MLPEPAQLTVDDINAAATAAEVLRTGEGTHTVAGPKRSWMTCDVSALSEAIIPAGATRREVTYTIFGQEVALGEADYEMPMLKAVDVTRWVSLPHLGSRGVRAG